MKKIVFEGEEGVFLTNDELLELQKLILEQKQKVTALEQRLIL